jgi:MYXO-CTERM domain-containing protein
MNVHKAMQVATVALATWCGLDTTLAHAHIKLLKPAAWLKENDLGGPQKGGPCGPGGGDDVQPTPTSGAITTFEVGETITLEWTETVPHPGHFRVAFAADRNELKDPELEVDANCNYDESKLPTGAHGNVLADGLFLRPRSGPRDETGKIFSTQITLPSEPCEKCTLQVLQFMENHPPKCIYYHCADVRLVPRGSQADADAGVAQGGKGAAAGSGAATGGNTAAAGSKGTAGKTAAATGGSTAAAGSSSAPSSGDSGGCSVQRAGAQRGAGVGIGLVLALLGYRRRRRRAA